MTYKIGKVVMESWSWLSLFVRLDARTAVDKLAAFNIQIIFKKHWALSCRTMQKRRRWGGHDQVLERRLDNRGEWVRNWIFFDKYLAAFHWNASHSSQISGPRRSGQTHLLRKTLSHTLSRARLLTHTLCVWYKAVCTIKVIIGNLPILPISTQY